MNMDMKRKLAYEAPAAAVITLAAGTVVCQSDMSFYNPGSAGNDINPKDIIDGGSF